MITIASFDTELLRKLLLLLDEDENPDKQKTVEPSAGQARERAQQTKAQGVPFQGAPSMIRFELPPSMVRPVLGGFLPEQPPPQMPVVPDGRQPLETAPAYDRYLPEQPPPRLPLVPPRPSAPSGALTEALSAVPQMGKAKRVRR